MTYMDQVNEGLAQTLALPTTPEWARPVLVSISSFTIGMRGLFHLLQDVKLSIWILDDISTPTIERMLRESDFPEWMRGALGSAIQDGDSAWDATRRHTRRDMGLLRRALMARTQEVFKGSIMYNEYEVVDEGQAVANIQESLEVLRGPTQPGIDWGIEPLEEGISDGVDWHGLYRILCDLNLLVILMDSNNDRHLEGWVDSDIPPWMRTALVHFRVAGDQWSRGRQIADAEVVEQLLGALWASKTNELQGGRI